uniref:Uncharacterized protein n=1 Tax=Anguilla anguilla TaxID=7936 RepID=A0A0E9R5X9_ANGAN
MERGRDTNCAHHLSPTATASSVTTVTCSST